MRTSLLPGLLKTVFGILGLPPLNLFDAAATGFSDCFTEEADSSPYEALLRMHWIGLLRGRVKLSLAATGGIHSANEAIKMLLTGADITQLCTTLLKNGPERLTEILSDIENWIDKNEYESVEQLKGSMSRVHCPDPSVLERANYTKALVSYTTEGV